YRGLDEWEMAGPLIGHGFNCAVTQTALILEPAGIESEMTYKWVIGSGPESSLGGSNQDYTLIEDFWRDYRNWLATAHPDVEADMQFDSGVVPTAESVPSAIEYVDEFVAQSDSYPLTAPVPEANYYGGPIELSG
ncbi:MAG: hypothetical protein ACR2PK_06300, partial [Acidimicrobiales bacterium]